MLFEGKWKGEIEGISNMTCKGTFKRQLKGNLKRKFEQQVSNLNFYGILERNSKELLKGVLKDCLKGNLKGNLKEILIRKLMDTALKSDWGRVLMTKLLI